MSDRPDPPIRTLVPPPQVIRAQLAQRVRETRLLRRLLRLSVDAAEDPLGNVPSGLATDRHTR